MRAGGSTRAPVSADRPGAGTRRSSRRVLAVLAAVTVLVGAGLGSAAAPVAAHDEVEVEDLAAAAERAQEQLAELEGQQGLARLVLADLEAQLVELEAQLAQAQTEWVAAAEKLDAAEVHATTMAAAAAEAELEARAADDELAESLRKMYVRPPRSDQAAVRGASNLEDHSQVHAILSTQSSKRHRLLKRAETARKRAETRLASAERARRAAEAEQLRTEAAAAELEQARTALTEEMSYAAVLLSALDAQHADLSAQAVELATRAAIQEAMRTATLDESLVVSVPGTSIRVHSLIAANTVAMIEAARADGVVLDGWGWRSTQRQIELRQAHCGPDYFSVFEKASSTCSPPTARPGRSMHERGLAIDFKNCSSRETACFRWLAANAARYGFYNLPSEPWHWSVNGN